MKTFHWCLFSILLAGVGLGSYELGRHHSAGAIPTGVPTQASITSPTKVAVTSAAPEPLWKSAKESKIHWEERIKAVRALPDPLSEASLQELLAFLHEVPSGSKSDWYLVCNEIMEVLRKRNLASGSYTKHMLGVVQDSSADPVIRDYAVQTLAQWIAGMDASLGHEKDAAISQQAFTALLVEAQKEGNGKLTLVGTTLNALADAVTTGTPEMQLNQSKVAEAAMAYASGKLSAAPLNRSTAIQVAAKLNVAELPSLCRELVAQENTPADVRLSAIAALGQTGSSQDITILKTLSKNFQLQYAADAAVKRLSQP